MEILLFFITIITFSLGLSSIIILIPILFKYKIRILIWYLLFISIISVLFFIELIELYIGLDAGLPANPLFAEPVPIIPPLIVTIILNYLFYAVIIIILPYLVHLLTDKKFSGFKKIIFFILSFFYPVGLVIFFIIRIELLGLLADIIFLSVLIYSIILLNRNLQNIRLLDVRRFSRMIFRIFMFFTPLFVFENLVLPFIHGLPSWLYRFPVFHIAFFINLSILNILYTIRYFFTPAEDDFFSVPKGFIQNFNITGRELEIISQILSGGSNKEIAGNLSITEKTVKNHVYNIFQKCEVRSRIELIKQLAMFRL